MTLKQMIGLATAFINTPMIAWAEAFNQHKHRGELDVSLQGTTVAFARAAAYVNRRLLGGSHDQAVKHQNTVAAKVRRALGYTQARSDISF